MDLKVHRVADSQNKGAWIFQSPLDVRDRELGGDIQPARARLYGHFKGGGVVLPAEAEYSGDFRVRNALRSDFALFPRRREKNLWKFRALQNFSVHFLVARGVVRGRARRVDDHAPTGITRLGIKHHVAALQLERAMNGMHGGTESEFDGGVGRVQINRRPLRTRLR